VIEDFLEVGVAVLVDYEHVHVSWVKPACPLGIVDDSGEFHQKLMEDGQRVVSSGDGCDDGVHVDTEVQEIKNGCHCAN
jgi:hypothetical protein